MLNCQRPGKDFDVLNSSFFYGGLIRAIWPNLCVSDLSVFCVVPAHDNKETDGTTLTLRFVARVEKPIQGEFSSTTSLTSPKILVF